MDRWGGAFAALFAKLGDDLGVHLDRRDVLYRPVDLRAVARLQRAAWLRGDGALLRFLSGAGGAVGAFARYELFADGHDDFGDDALGRDVD